MIYDGIHLRVLRARHELTYLARLYGAKRGRTLGCVRGCNVLVQSRRYTFVLACGSVPCCLASGEPLWTNDLLVDKRFAIPAYFGPGIVYFGLGLVYFGLGPVDFGPGPVILA